VEVVRANGLDIAYERAGEGPPLVFAHGAATDSRLWRAQLAALAGEFTVVAWDEPGAGRSEDVPHGFGLADYADCLAALIESLELGPAHSAGLSWGGTVALELYRRHPSRVATLILADTYAGWKGSLPKEELRARIAHAREAVAAPRQEFDPTLPGLFSADPPAEALAALAEMAADVTPESLGTQLGVMAEADLRDLLPRIEVPTLLVWGEQDARSPLSVARQFERAIPDTTLVVIPDAGHVSNLEQPERFDEAVREFCRAHAPRAPDGPDAVPAGSEFAARVYAAINARDRAAIRALTAPDFMFGSTVEAYRGPEAVLEWMDEGDDAFDDFSVELLEVEELGGQIVVSMRQRGRGKVGGAEVDDHITHVWTLRDGRATSVRSFANHDDAVGFARQHGE
jgi:pimeloyl-ACP methyl ester carboxylesterase/ketosteroid isomerase-like protein